MPSIDLGSAGPPESKRLSCLTPSCGKSPIAYKGLCMTCYKTAKKLVEAKQTTWEALAQMGLADLGTSNKFTEAFKAKQKEQ